MVYSQNYAQINNVKMRRYKIIIKYLKFEKNIMTWIWLFFSHFMDPSKVSIPLLTEEAPLFQINIVITVFYLVINITADTFTAYSIYFPIT